MKKRQDNPDDSPLEPSSQRRFAMLIGLVILILVLAFLGYFMLTHTEMPEPGGSIFGISSVLSVLLLA